VTEADAQAARDLVRALPGPTLVLGTFGLVLHGWIDASHAADVDVLARVQQVPDMVVWLMAHGFRVWSWQDELTGPPSLERLTGRFYVRARRGSLVLDVTYEGLDVDAWLGDAANVDGIAVGNALRIVAAKRRRDNENDRRVLALIRPA
jgi:hypothetical protein